MREIFNKLSPAFSKLNQITGPEVLRKNFDKNI